MGLIGAELLDGGSAVRLTWKTGQSARFHAIWLRDNAQDEATRDPGNGQRKITLADIPGDIAIRTAKPDGDALSVTFSDDHDTRFDADWLKARTHDGRAAAKSARNLWTGDLKPHGAALSDMQADTSTLRDWLAAVDRDGVATVSGMPTESGALEAIVKTFGHIRETNYGRWFEVRAEVNPTNLAYTNLGLQAHTDNPYRDPVPGLQVLACLENTVEGGESAVVDGFAAAEALRAEDPAAFAVLASFPARFEYAGSGGVRLQAKRPILECGPDGELITIRFNNRSLAPVTDVPFEAVGAWYAALRRLGEIIDDPANAVTFRMEPGEAFIVDNTRVLHARTAFSGSGQRWLQGCYADLDGLRSTLAALEVA